VAVSAADLTGRRQDLIAAEEAALTETVVEGVALTQTVAVGVDLMVAAVDLMAVLTVAAEVVAADGEAVADLMVMDSAMAVSVVAAAEAVADLEEVGTRMEDSMITHLIRRAEMEAKEAEILMMVDLDVVDLVAAEAGEDVIGMIEVVVVAVGITEGEIGRKIMILIGRKIMSKKRDL